MGTQYAGGGGDNSSLVAGEGIDITGSAPALTILGEDASPTNKGIIELANVTEVEAGNDSVLAVSPFTLATADMVWRAAHEFKEGEICWQQRGGFTPADNNASLEGWGMYGSITEATSDSNAAGLDSGGLYWEQVTLALAAEPAYVYLPVDVTRLAYLPIFVYKFSLRSTTSQRFFVGLAEDTTVHTSDTPTGEYIGIKYSTATSDTNFEIIHRNTTLTTVDTGIAVDTNPHYCYIRVDSTSSVFIALLDNVGTVEYSTTLTTELPASTTGLRPGCGLTTTAASSKTMAHYMSELVNRI